MQSMEGPSCDNFVLAILDHEYKSTPRLPRYTNVLVKWRGYDEPTWHGASTFRRNTVFEKYLMMNTDLSRVFSKKVVNGASV